MALVDRDVLHLDAMGEPSRQGVDVHVAGVAALLCAKSWKLSERIADADAGRPWRLREKDAADVWRLMMVGDPRAVRSTFAEHEGDATLGRPIAAGREMLIDLFRPGGRGPEMAASNLAGKVSRAAVTGSIGEWMRAFGP